MLSKDAPSCLCGGRNYTGGGGSVGGAIATTCFGCADCGRTIWIIQDDQQPIALMDTNNDILAGLSMENYVNDVLLPSRRAYALNPSPYPPCLPDNITAFQLGKDGHWYIVDHAVSQSLPIPQDPSKKRHENFWRELLAKTGLTKAVREVKNRYYDDRRNAEPWYEFNPSRDVTVTFGPRKRVYSIKVSKWLGRNNLQVIPFNKIKSIADTDKVTYSDSIEGHRQEMEVHAWGEDKFVEYFKCVMDELNAAEV